MRGVLFDLDGTLIDRDRSIAAYASRFIDDFGSDLDTHDVETANWHWRS